MKQAGHLEALSDLVSSVDPGHAYVGIQAKQITWPCLLLNGQLVSDGDHLSILVIDSWVVGEVRQDQHGWYLLTPARVGIRLSAGLTARFEWEEEEEARES
ncbi:hypothetical protein KSF_085610 [Reticulibacter mediterranei]|uniref:Uncharacterized protein n=1 Tax=Reticulibacter mediterranei TaxID=2778369 RepID=A0A8J3N7E1_9CHLR|nr:DUF5348 domain-containing protein [Reticulibacter mediterranei]GHO98513.1 hypothetical protein KSF_085610 [Reticulibacter mediterranei]